MKEFKSFCVTDQIFRLYVVKYRSYKLFRVTVAQIIYIFGGTKKYDAQTKRG